MKFDSSHLFPAVIVIGLCVTVLAANQTPAPKDDQPPPGLLEQRVQVLIDRQAATLQELKTLRAEVIALQHHQASDAELHRIATAALARAESVSAAAEKVRQSKQRKEISLPCTPAGKK